MSRGKRRSAVRPGDCLVVEGAGFQAAVQDAGQPVGQSPQCVFFLPEARVTGLVPP
jgi:hypothetical protein